MHNITVTIEFDPAKVKANFRKHRIHFSDAEQVLYDPNALTHEDPDADGESRFVTLGMDSQNRVLVVVYTHRGKKIRLISARKASSGEMEQYHA